VANEHNLIPNSQRSPNEVRENGAKGGIASGEARRKKRDIRRALEALLEKDYFVEEYGTLSGAEAIAVRQMERALDGDTKAFEVVRDSAGQKQPDKVETKQTIVDLSKFTIDELKGMLDTEV
jgi:hypothetical protein